MTIAVVQSFTAPTSANTAYTGSFGSNVTALDSVILSATGASSTGGGVSSSGPTFNGSTPPGSVKAADQADASGHVYQAIWLMPAVAGGAAGTGLTVTGNNFTGGPTGLVGLEVSGLGSSPTVDQATSNTGSGTTGNSGTTGAITSAPEIVVAGLVWYGTTPALVGAPWTELQFGSDYSISAYRIVTSSGGTYQYATTSGSAFWSGAIATIATSLTAAAEPIPYLTQNGGMF